MTSEKNPEMTSEKRHCELEFMPWSSGTQAHTQGTKAQKNSRRKGVKASGRQGVKASMRRYGLPGSEQADLIGPLIRNHKMKHRA
jgi:hypothetical protein